MSDPEGAVAGDPVVVIGNFDGVHRGHAELIRTALAAEPGAPLVAVTFWPHPMSVIRPDQAPLLLTSLERRIELLKAAGAAQVVVVDSPPRSRAGVLRSSSMPCCGPCIRLGSWWG